MRGVLAVCSQCAGVFQQVQSQLLRQIDFLNARLQQLELILYKQTQQLAQAEIQYHQRETLPSTTSLPNLPSPIPIQHPQPPSSITPSVVPQYQQPHQPSNHQSSSQPVKPNDWEGDHQNERDELQLINLKQNGSHLPNSMPAEKAGRTLQSKLSNRRYLL